MLPIVPIAICLLCDPVSPCLLNIGDPTVEKQYPIGTRDPGCLHYICSTWTKRFAWQSVHSVAPHAILRHIVRTNWGQNGHSASPTVPSSQEGSHFILSRGKRGEKKQYNAASRKASRRIARAPRLSCLYKQALIFLSSSGTSAIYSQPCGWGPAGLEKFCYSPVRPLRPVCENRFHL